MGQHQNWENIHMITCSSTGLKPQIKKRWLLDCLSAATKINSWQLVRLPYLHSKYGAPLGRAGLAASNPRFNDMFKSHLVRLNAKTVAQLGDFNNSTDMQLNHSMPVVSHTFSGSPSIHILSQHQGNMVTSHKHCSWYP